jgi:hypothetical protein
MAQFAAPPHLATTPVMILVGRDERGAWGVFGNGDQMEGSFAERDEALRFARLLRAASPGSILMQLDAEVVSAPARSAA